MAPNYTPLRKWQHLLAAQAFSQLKCTQDLTRPLNQAFNWTNCMWFKPRWSSVPSSVLDLCTTWWCREGLGCVWRSVVWVHVSSRKQFSNSVYLVCLSILSSSPKFSFKLWFHPKAKPKQNSAKVCLILSSNGKQLNFIWFSPSAINHLGLTCCTVQVYGGLGNLLVGQTGILSSSS